MLLVDSEGEVAASDEPWQHVLKSDGWDRPEHAANNSLFLMVQCMETWFIADGDGLKAYYGQEFDVRKLSSHRSDVEKIPKEDVYKALDGATRNCTKGRYRRSKGRHSFRILAKVDP